MKVLYPVLGLGVPNTELQTTVYIKTPTPALFGRVVSCESRQTESSPLATAKASVALSPGNIGMINSGVSSKCHAGAENVFWKLPSPAKRCGRQGQSPAFASAHLTTNDSG